MDKNILLTPFYICLHAFLHAPGLTPRAVLDKFAAIQMLDVHFPTTDGRTLILSRHTQPEPDQKLLLEKLNLQLPDQPPPRISSRGLVTSDSPAAVVKTF